MPTPTFDMESIHRVMQAHHTREFTKSHPALHRAQDLLPVVDNDEEALADCVPPGTVTALFTRTGSDVDSEVKSLLTTKGERLGERKDCHHTRSTSGATGLR